MRLAIAIPFKLSLNLHELPCYPPVKKGKEINEYMYKSEQI